MAVVAAEAVATGAAENGHTEEGASGEVGTAWGAGGGGAGADDFSAPGGQEGGRRGITSGREFLEAMAGGDGCVESDDEDSFPLDDGVGMGWNSFDLGSTLSLPPGTAAFPPRLLTLR